MTLVEFLLAQYAEDEDEARHALPHSGGLAFANDDYGRLLIDPTRVLRECEAKRLTVELHQPHDPREDILEGCKVCCSGRDGYRDEWEIDPWPCPTIRALALPFADHPDFDEAWLLDTRITAV